MRHMIEVDASKYGKERLEFLKTKYKVPEGRLATERSNRIVEFVKENFQETNSLYDQRVSYLRQKYGGLEFENGLGEKREDKSVETLQAQEKARTLEGFQEAKGRAKFGNKILKLSLLVKK